MNLEILKQREQLMEDIDSICDDFFYSNYNGDISEAEELIRTLCDAVCKKLPHKLMQFQILSVEFDVDDSCYDPLLEPPTSEELAEMYIGEIWEADDEDDLIEEITNDAAHCILSIDFRHILK